MKMNLSSKILMGLIAGMACGIFFGEQCGHLYLIGYAYINLLQMSVLPFIVVSLVHGIGSLTATQAKRLAAAGGVLLVVFLFIGTVMVLAATWAFPDIESASFFSTIIPDIPHKAINPLDMYIPANPFRSLAENVIPAVVVFSIFFGVALIGIEGKDALLKSLHLLVQALMRVAGFAVKVAPLGVFAITAAAAGSISISEISRLQVFIITDVLAACILAFVIIPGLVGALTPFRSRDVLAISKEALILAFTTANAFVVLPLITENVKTLFARHKNPSAERVDCDSFIEVMPPLVYNFSHPGKMLALLFVFFAAWFFDRPIDPANCMKVIGLGILSLIGSPRAALPFLLQQMKLPGDIFQLYLISEIVVDRVQTLLTCISVLVFTVLTAARMSGMIKLNLRKLSIFLCVVFVLTIAVLVAARYGLFLLTKDSYRGKEIVSGMNIHESVQAKVFMTREEAGLPRDSRSPARNDSLLRDIRGRKVLRVGYRPDVIPFSYFNQSGELVGFDIAFAHRLARDLGCAIEFIPTDRRHFAADLQNGDIDIMMSKVPVTAELYADVRFTESYLTLHAAFVVEDSRKQEFMKLDDIRKIKGLRIAISRDNVYQDELRSLFPNASLVIVNKKKRFFKEKIADALFVTAEEGASWSLMYPFYDFAEPQPPLFMEFLSYPVARGNDDFLEYLNHWIQMQQQSGTKDKDYDYWILGKDAYGKKPRWSVIRDVLHWTE